VSAPIEITFRKITEEVGSIWIGDETITEERALEFAASVIPADWVLHPNGHHFDDSWAVLAHREGAL
jgi:hypothetical protein